MTRRWTEFLFVLIVVMSAAPACQMIGAAAYFFGPKRVQKPEFEFTKTGRVAIVIESSGRGEQSPAFNRALEEGIIRVFREREQPIRFVSPADVLTLRRQNPDFATWSLQRIGRELEADEVLYVRIEALQAVPTPDHPILEPVVRLTAKVVDANPEAEQPRLWPLDDESRTFMHARPPLERVNAAATDAELGKLARETAVRMCTWFLETDLETPLPRER